MNFVKIGRDGGRIIEYAVNLGTTMKEILTIAEIFPDLNEEIVMNGIVQKGNYMTESVLDRSVTIIKKFKTIAVRVARIGEQLTRWTIPSNQKIRDFLKQIGKTLYENEELWVHKDGELKGRKALMDDMLFDGEILVIEKRNILIDKIKTIISYHFEEEMGYEVVDDASYQLHNMLVKEYKIL